MKLRNIALAIAITTTTAATFAGFVTVKTMIGVTTCTGEGAKCLTQQQMGAIGDPFNVDPSKVTVTDLGSVSAAKKIVLNLPTKPDATNVFSFTPTTGELAGKIVYFGFKRHAEARSGTQFAGLQVIEVVRQNLDDAKAIWYKSGQLTSDKGFPATFDFTIKPNGDLVTLDPTTEKDVTIELGLRKPA